MRKKRLIYNTLTAFLYQITNIICGFILPRLILQQFGSDVNGLVNSISQFLNIIAFLDLGVGRVVQTSLYKPLAQKDNVGISKIIVSAENFFKRIAYILVLYVLLLVGFYPRIASADYSWAATAFLIIAISISYFAQYYFGVVNRLLLNASQLGYIYYSTQVVTLILNTVICAILIKHGFSIQIVKLTTSLIFLVRPLILKIYVDKNFEINHKITYDEEPIKQKWNGLAQHIAAIVLEETDSIVLTLFSTLANVSIYGVYHLVVYGVRQIFVYMVSGVQALLGDMWAKNETEKLQGFFSDFEWIVHTSSTFLFACTAALIVPFVEVYTLGITDAEYSQPLFALLITLSQWVFCLRIPYNNMILAAGHFKQTQRCYVVATTLNLVVSIATVIRFGLIGVAIGTLVAMTYQTIWMALYNAHNLLNRRERTTIKQVIVDIFVICGVLLLSRGYSITDLTYGSWLIMAVKVGVTAVAVTVSINVVIYFSYVRKYVVKLCKVIKK